MNSSMLFANKPQQSASSDFKSYLMSISSEDNNSTGSSSTDHLSQSSNSITDTILQTPCDQTTSNIVHNLRNMMAPEPVEIPVIHIPTQPPPKLTTQLSSNSSQFIDPTELKNKFYQFSSKFLLILLDCRTYNDFNMKHIKDSVHLNCRDKLTRKRLQTRKISVKDLISSEEIKNKFEDGNEVHYSEPEKVIFEEECTNPPDNMIVLYDDTTSDLSELQSDQNPLKIVQENIKQSGYKRDCRILKGGFKSFFENFPEFCSIKDLEEEQRLFMSKHQDYVKEMKEDQRQSAIDNSVMTEITPYLFLGNESDAKNCENLEKKGIYYILNVTKNIPFYNLTNKLKNDDHNTNTSDVLDSSPFLHKRIAVNDCENQNLKNYFEEASDFIDQAKRNNEKVLVHCQAGISRSPTVVIAYLMSRFKLDMDDAYNRVKLERPIIGPNLLFMSQLQEYDINLHLKSNTAPLGKCTPINVVHVNTNTSNTQKSVPNSPQPVSQAVQIEVQHVNSSKNNNSENVENTSPCLLPSISGLASSTSYFKISKSSSNISGSVNCINSNNNNNKTNGENNNSILVFN